MVRIAAIDWFYDDSPPKKTRFFLFSFSSNEHFMAARREEERYQVSYEQKIFSYVLVGKAPSDDDVGMVRGAGS